jgi:hypothetical protein
VREPLDGAHIHLDHRQGLADLVVQLASDMIALGLLGIYQPPHIPAQPLLRPQAYVALGLELLLSALARLRLVLQAGICLRQRGRAFFEPGR